MDNEAKLAQIRKTIRALDEILEENEGADLSYLEDIRSARHHLVKSYEWLLEIIETHEV